MQERRLARRVCRSTVCARRSWVERVLQAVAKAVVRHADIAPRATEGPAAHRVPKQGARVPQAQVLAYSAMNS